MAHNRSNVVVVFQNRDQVQCAEEELRRAGYRDDQIGVAMRNDQGTTTIEKRGTKAAEGAAGGVVAGGVIGGLLGAAASLLLPGIGPVVAGGILATTLAGAATGAVAGGLLGTLMGMGVPEEEARYYDNEFRSGRIVLTVKADGHYDEVRDILYRCGAYDMEHQAMAAGTMTDRVTDDETIRLREEQLNIRKKPVQTGEVNIRKEVITENKTVDVPVSREEIVIERKDLKNRPATGDVGEDKQIRIPVSEEEVHVDKTAVDTEEIRVRKDIATDTKRVSEDVKREQARVERKGNTKVRGSKEVDNTDTDESI